MTHLFNPATAMVVRTPFWSFKKADKLSVDEILRSLDDPSFSEALWIATPVLAKEAVKWRTGQLDKKKSEKVLFSLAKYYLRMCTRTTPFGLFTGCSVLHQTESNGWTAKECSPAAYKTVRLDMDFLCRLIEWLERDEAVRRLLNYRVNTSLYQIGNRYRYIEYQKESSERKYSLTAVDVMPELEHIIRFCAQEAKPYDAIITALTHIQVSDSDARDFIDELITAQVLVSNLEPAVTKPDGLQHLIDQISSVNDGSLIEKLEFLIDLRSSVQKLCTTAPNPISDYEAILSKIEVAGVPYEPSKVFQVDFFNNAPDFAISSEQVDHLLDAVSQLSPLCDRRENGNIVKFINKMYELHEGAEIPLASLMDSDIGIGYPVGEQNEYDTPLIDDISLFKPFPQVSTSLNQLGLWQLRLLIDAVKSETEEIELHTGVLAPLGPGMKTAMPKDVQPSWSALFSEVEVDGKKKLVFKSASGNSALDILGRFSSGNQEIYELTSLIAAHECASTPDQIVADILHLPETRAGNVITRLEHFKYQIPYLASPTTDVDSVLPITDLKVSVDANANKVYLRSEKFDRLVLPRLSNAHNFMYRSLSIYRFLCEVQNQSLYRGIMMKWVDVVKGLTAFRPRLTLGDVIISPASWILTADKINLLNDVLTHHIGRKDSEILPAIASWRQKYKIAERVVLEDGDHDLYVNFSNVFNVQVFVDEAKGKELITLEEFFDNGEDQCNEMVLPLLRRHDMLNERWHRIVSSTENVKRKILPADGVLYFKIYAGSKLLEELLVNDLKDVLARLGGAYIDQWFFIRFADPNTHLRLRLFINEAVSISMIVKEFNNLLQDRVYHGEILSYNIDTYCRELERYHPDHIDSCERIFFHDSQAVIDILSLIYNNSEREEYRWLAAMLSVDYFLADIGLSTNEKLSFIAPIREGFFNEFGGQLNTNRALSKKHRSKRNQMQMAFGDGVENMDPIIQEIRKVLFVRSEAIRPWLKHIHTHDRQALPELMVSLIHMNLNRFFISEPRKHELVIYDFLHRQYQSLQSRANKSEYA